MLRLHPRQQQPFLPQYHPAPQAPRALSGRGAPAFLMAGISAMLLAGAPLLLTAQGTASDYQRAGSVHQRIQGTVIDAIESPTWLNGSRFWYRKSVSGGNAFVLVDARTREKKAAFDHADVARALSAATGRQYTAVTLPFSSFSFVDNEKAIEVSVDSARWHCSTVAPAECSGANAGVQRGGGFAGGRGGAGGFRQLFGGGLYGGDGGRNTEVSPRRSPDGLNEAFVRDHNIWLRELASGKIEQLSFDGAEGDAYSAQSISWSPNSRSIAAYRVVPGYRHEIYYVQSSPMDQLQPRLVSRLYNKPGDVLDINQPVLFDVASKREIAISNALFPNAYTMSALQWRKDGRAVHFEYNQRGHQVFRVIELDAVTGAARAVVNEESPTFFTYSSKRYRFDLNDGRESIWMSERDGWNHLWLMDAATGAARQQITSGKWVVRGVDRVDAVAKQIWFRASGMNPDQDPYFVHYYRTGIDGSGLTALTQANGNHVVSMSPSGEYYVDTWSRVDLPPVAQLRRSSDQSVVMELEQANAASLFKTGIRAPEAFVARGRDDSTDIYGIIVRPSNFDARRKYPVIEYIYAGPHDSFVPKSWGIPEQMQAQAELGFIVVQIDGMGTSNRSKAFHDVAWQNLADAGFPDRIRWHQAVAAKYSWYDISRVGIYGGSAGGQNSTGALLFHPEFYKVAVSFAGCHDNRMDKIWWNEQWMGWPVGPQYSRSSNVDNAYRLQGRLLLIVGEMDENVDPASTMQVADALVRANKRFDLFVFPNGDHGVGRRGPLTPYGDRLQWDYFVHHLLGVEPPDRNRYANGAVSDGAQFDSGDADTGSSFSVGMGESWSEIAARWGQGR